MGESGQLDVLNLAFSKYNMKALYLERAERAKRSTRCANCAHVRKEHMIALRTNECAIVIN